MASVTANARVRQRYGLHPVNVESASGPLMLFRASHPSPPRKAFGPAGSRLPRKATS
jgi:hypothetical protein